MKLIKYILPIFFVVCCYASQAQVAIPNEANIDESAELNVHSTTKGMLIPCLTIEKQNCISKPATSLWIFNTDITEFTFFNGTIWQSFNSIQTTTENTTTGTTEGDILFNSTTNTLLFNNSSAIMQKLNLTGTSL